jgi:signal recognition particle subunit SRP54
MGRIGNRLSLSDIMFPQLSEKLQEVFKDLRGHGTLSEANIESALRQVRLALLEADVDFQVARRIQYSLH